MAIYPNNLSGKGEAKIHRDSSGLIFVQFVPNNAVTFEISREMLLEMINSRNGLIMASSG